MIKKIFKPLFYSTLAAFLLSAAMPVKSQNQDYQKYLTGTLSGIEWAENGKTVQYVNNGKKFSLDLKTKAIAVLGESKEKRVEGMFMRPKTTQMGKRLVDNPLRGFQFMTEMSPNGQWYSVCRDWNIFLENDSTKETIQVSTEGFKKFRYGTANWTYGEELAQKHGMWWSPDSKKVIYYVFDERPVKDFYLVGNWTEINTSLLTEGYMKAGCVNAIVTLEIYDLDKKVRTLVDVGQNQQDQYIYEMRFTPDGKELLFNRIDRRQQKLNVMALDIETGKTRLVVSETQDTWQENAPEMQFLEDGKRFIWETEKTGYKQYELRHLDGQLICTLTKGDFPAISIVKVDEKNNWFYYKAAGDKHPLNEQLYRVKLNGKDQQRITPLSMNYTRLNISPDGKWFIAQYEEIQAPASTVLYSTEGKLVKLLAQGAKPEVPLTEMFSFKAADGKTDLYGVIHKPANFDPNKKYPVLLSVYGGPDSKAVSNRFMNGNPNTSKGYLMVQIDNRGTSGRGKAFKAAVYKKLGDVDILDQADGIKFLCQRPYIDKTRIGIVGHSYGGFMAAMGLLRFPDVFAVAVDRAGPTDWRNYDNIYTERFMGLPQENKEGYDNGAAMKYVANIKEKGHLLIMHGMIDDNVHPNNAFQLINALDKEKIKYESRFFPNNDHGFDGSDTQWDFFHKYLIAPYEN